MGKRPLVRVRVFRVFEYPKSMLHKEIFIKDALGKAAADMQVMLDEMVKNDHVTLDAKMFEMEATEERGYTFRPREAEVDDSGSVNIALAAKALTNRAMEGKYGVLNHETNPSIFVSEPEVRNGQGALIREATWYMRQDVERDYYELYDDFIRFLRSTK